MTTAVQLRRGTTAEHATFTGLEGETTVDTTKTTLVVHNGSTAGGFAIAREDLANVSPTNLPVLTGADTASDDKFLIYDQSALTLKQITRAELNNAIEQDPLSNVQIISGTINGTTIGGTTAAGGSFTTLSSNSTTTLNGTTIPASKTLVDADTAQTLTNKTLTSPAITTPTGLVKGDVGLGNVDNTSDATKNAATATLTNKTISGANNTLSNIGNASLTNSSITFGSTAQALGSTVSALNGVSIGATTASTGSFTSLTNSGNLAFTGTGNRITGDFGNPTFANRVAFQSSSVNSGTQIAVLPNGTSTNSGFDCYASSDPTNTSRGLVRIDAAGNDFRFNSTITGTGSFLPMTFHTGGSERVRIDTSGNVGIGTSSPTGKLQSFTTSFAPATSAWTNAALVVSGGFGGGLALIDGPAGYGVWVQDSGGTLAIGQGATSGAVTERMRIDSAGNVGIGTSSPGSALTVARAGLATMSLLAGATGSTEFVQSGGNDVARHVLAAGGQTPYVTSFDISQSGGGQANVQNRANSPIVFFTNNAERMRIDNAGNVGIGTSSPSTRLTVLGQTYSTTGFSTTTDASTFTPSGFSAIPNYGIGAPGSNFVSLAGFLGLTFYTNQAERMRIDSSGNLLVGTTGVLTSGRVSAIGSINAFVGRVPDNTFSNFVGENTSGSVTFFVQGSGQINSTSTSIAAISDQSLKENVRDLETGLVEVMALRPRRFDWKEGEGTGEKDVAGFIAQELEAVLPDLVYEFPRGDEEAKKAIKMGDILPTLVKAMQEMKAIIDSQAERIAALEAK
jgi:hypothetical protein